MTIMTMMRMKMLRMMVMDSWAKLSTFKDLIVGPWAPTIPDPICPKPMGVTSKRKRQMVMVMITTHMNDDGGEDHTECFQSFKVDSNSYPIVATHMGVTYTRRTRRRQRMRRAG